MANNIIGFIGLDQYDTILYLSRMLHHMGRRVALLDCSDSQSLAFSIPRPRNLKKEKGDESSNEYEAAIHCIEYQGVYYYESLGNETWRTALEENEDVLIQFGFHDNPLVYEKCTKLIYYIDQMQSTIERIRPFLQYNKKERVIVLRKVYDCSISTEYIMMRLGLSKEQNECVELYLEPMDIKYGIENQYNQGIRFTRISRGFQNYLKEIAKEMLPKLTEKELNAVIRKVKKGGKVT